MTTGPRPRRAVLLLRSLGYGGGTRVEIEEARALAPWDVALDVMAGSDRWRDLEAEARAIAPPVRDVRAVGRQAALVARLWAGRYDLALVGRSRRVYRALAKERRIPFARRPAVVVTLHEHYRTYLDLLAEDTRALADVLLLTFDFRAEAEAALGVPRERMVVAPPLYPSLLQGRDPEAPERGRRLRERLGAGPGAIVVGCHGRVTPRKGVDRLLGMVGRLRRDGGDVHLVVAGRPAREEPEWAARLDAEASRVVGPRGEPRVHLLGPVADLAGTVASFDLMALCTASEGYFPLVLVEALSLGVPVVTTGVGGIRHALRDGEDALVVAKSRDDASDVDGETAARFEAALRRLVADADLRARLGRDGRDRVEALVAQADFHGAVRRAASLALEVRGRR